MPTLINDWANGRATFMNLILCRIISDFKSKPIFSDVADHWLKFRQLGIDPHAPYEK